jgi:hypothetical protein
VASSTKKIKARSGLTYRRSEHSQTFQEVVLYFGHRCPPIETCVGELSFITFSPGEKLSWVVKFWQGAFKEISISKVQLQLPVF